MFKMKVGKNIEQDRKRSKLIRDVIGPNMPLMMDANQCWDVDEAWIEEHTSR